MGIYYAVKVDVSSKQSYIYSSNRLKEVIGASKIIEFVTEILGRIIIEEMKEEGKLVSQQKFTEIQKIYNKETKKTIEYRGSVHTEGGGNSIYMFMNEEDAIEFTKNFTTYVLDKFNNLEVTLVTQSFNLETDLAVEVYGRLEQKIGQKKTNLRRPLRKLNYGMYEKCKNNGNASGYEVLELSDNDKIVSKESYDKRKFYEIILMDRKNQKSIFNAGKQDFHNFDKDIYRIDKYKEEHIIKSKINWMKSYYVANENDFILSLIQSDKYEHKTILTAKEIKELKLRETKEFKIRPESIKEIAGIKENRSNKACSYIGLSCLDGNGMGKSLSELPKHFIELLKKELEKVANENNEYYKLIVENKSIMDKNIAIESRAKRIIKENNLFFFKFYEILTEEIQKTYETAFIEILLGINRKNSKMNLVKNEDSDRENIEPIVPIVLAGDDVSFWTGGMDSIDTNVEFLEIVAGYHDEKSLYQRIIKELSASAVIAKRFEDEKNDFISKGLADFHYLSISGGIAITDITYPVTRAAKLAQELESNAKIKGAKIKKPDEGKGLIPAMIDWELIRGDQKNKVSEMRAGIETKRPYVVVGCDKSDESKIDNNNEHYFVNFKKDFDKMMKILNGESDKNYDDEYQKFKNGVKILIDKLSNEKRNIYKIIIDKFEELVESKKYNSNQKQIVLELNQVIQKHIKLNGINNDEFLLELENLIYNYNTDASQNKYSNLFKKLAKNPTDAALYAKRSGVNSAYDVLELLSFYDRKNK